MRDLQPLLENLAIVQRFSEEITRRTADLDQGTTELRARLDELVDSQEKVMHEIQRYRHPRPKADVKAASNPAGRAESRDGEGGW